VPTHFLGSRPGRYARCSVAPVPAVWPRGAGIEFVVPHYAGLLPAAQYFVTATHRCAGSLADSRI